MTTELLTRPARLGFDRATLIGMTAIPMWSATVALYRGVAETFGPVGGTALIFTVSAVIALIMGGRDTLKGVPLRYAVWAIPLFVFYELALALAIGFANNRLQALEVGMINYLWPSVTIALAVGLRLERASWIILPGLVISVAGIVLISSGEGGFSLQRMAQNAASNPLAYGLALGAALSWPVYSLLTRLRSGGRNGIPLFLALIAICIWSYYLRSDEPPLVFDTTGAACVLTFGLLTTTAYTAWNHGIIHGNMTLMAAASYFAPVLSVMLSSLLLSLSLGLGFWIGTLMVTCGSLICWASTRGRVSRG